MPGADLVGPGYPRADMRGAQGAGHFSVCGAVWWETGGLCAAAGSSRNLQGLGVDARRDLNWDGEEECRRKCTAPPQLGTSRTALQRLAQRACRHGRFLPPARLAPRVTNTCRGNELTRSSSIHGEREGGFDRRLVQRFWHPSVCSLWLRVGCIECQLFSCCGPTDVQFSI